MVSQLQFSDLYRRHYGITPGVSAYFEEAARVCLSRHNVSPTDISLNDNATLTTATASWRVPSDRERAAHHNDIDATEAGAYCLALAAIELTRSVVAVGRAETLTGADYYLAPVGSQSDDLEGSLRLEVSGTDHGGVATVAARLAQKIQQAKDGKSDLPAVAAVVGFAEKLIRLQDVV